MSSAPPIASQPLLKALPDALQQLFSLLLRVNSESKLNATLRVAGGWVRDQVLERDADDIDIALETPPDAERYVTGVVFAEALKNALDGKTGSISVIGTNPDQSKHLETAQITVMGFHIEFMNLRQDDYTNHTNRIPTIRPAGPLEDARRRDFTCNSLFYNLHTERIEDYTGGIEDIRRGVLRCPLEPVQTFTDDPLRMLRGVRFAGQLGFSFHESVVSALVDKATSCEPPLFEPTFEEGRYSLLAATLWTKATRERCSIELIKMFAGRDPCLCHRYLANFGLLYSTVLVEHHPAKPANKKTAVPGMLKLHPAMPALASHRGPRSDPYTDEGQFLLRGILGCVTEHISPVLHLSLKSDERLCTTLFCILAPLLLKSPSPCFSEASQPELFDRVHAIVCVCMKFPNRIAEATGRMLLCYRGLVPKRASLCEAALAFDPATRRSQTQTITGELRLAVYQQLRENNRLAPILIEVVLAALGMTHHEVSTPLSGAQGTAQAVRTLFVTDPWLGAAATRKPSLNGKVLEQRLNVQKTQLSQVIEAQMCYLAHTPEASNDELLQHLIQIYGARPEKKADEEKK